MLNFNQLRTFHQAAKSLNFTVAGKNLFVSQPAVTAQIKLFEEFCNLDLFAKKGRRIYLTDEGKTIFKYTCRIFELEQGLEKTIYDLQKLKQGCLRIGTTKTYARYLMPVLLTPFHQSFPGVTIELNEGSSLEMSENVLDFRNSLAIIPRVDDNPDIHFIPLFREEVVLIAASDYHLSKRDRISIEELAGEPIVMKESGSGTRRLVEESFGDDREKLNIIAETSNMEFIKELVKQGEGISFVVRTAVKRELTEGTLVTIPITNRTLFLDVCIAYLSDYRLPMAAKAFLDFLQPVVRSRAPLRDIDTFLAEIRGKK
ncbi:MAG: LysR family transcriptional regulator [Proteobacteria bacterium]|nr:LysR family transcriptional regulator [Pseudomonadota bacterium]